LFSVPVSACCISFSIPFPGSSPASGAIVSAGSFLLGDPGFLLDGNEALRRWVVTPAALFAELVIYLIPLSVPLPFFFV
jgi:hypothetical protein